MGTFEWKLEIYSHLQMSHMPEASSALYLAQFSSEDIRSSIYRVSQTESRVGFDSAIFAID